MNWERAEEYIRKAKAAGAELIVFPEFFLGGPKITVENAQKKLSELAKKYEIDMVSGSYAEVVDNIVYNCSSYIDKDGNILYNYRKVNLWAQETKKYTAGEGYGTVKTRFGITVGIAVCWDIAFSDGFTEMVMNQGAELICSPTYWTLEDSEQIGGLYEPDTEHKFIDSICTARSFEYGIVMVFVNGAASPLPPPTIESSSLIPKDIQPSRYGILAGHTQITVPFKGAVAKCNHIYEDMIIQDVDVKKSTKDIESLYQLRQSWKTKLAKSTSRL
ncbi:unnamed protein product [Cunninghamella echinulata]